MNGYDLFRVLVLGQIAVTGGLYVWSFARLLSRVREARGPLRAITLGHLWRICGVVVLLVLAAEDVIQRLGKPTLNPKTPLAQTALICLLIAWTLIDRRRIVSARHDEAAPYAAVAVERLVREDELRSKREDTGGRRWRETDQ